MDSAPLAAARHPSFDRRAGRVMSVQMAFDHLDVAGVGPEEEIGDRADPGNEPEQEIEADIAGHPADLPFRHAEIAGFPNDVSAECRCRDVADAGDQVEDDVEADRAIEARDDEHPLEQ